MKTGRPNKWLPRLLEVVKANEQYTAAELAELADTTAHHITDYMRNNGLHPAGVRFVKLRAHKVWWGHQLFARFVDDTLKR